MAAEEQNFHFSSVTSCPIAIKEQQDYMASQLTMEEETRELVKEEETSNKSIEVVNSSGAIIQELVIGVNKPLIKTDQFPGTEEREEGNEEEPEGSGGTDEGEGATQVMMDAVPLPVQASDYLGPTEFVSGIDDALPTTVTAIVDALTAYMH